MCWGSNDVGQLLAGSTGTFKSQQKVELGSGCIQSKTSAKIVFVWNFAISCADDLGKYSCAH